MGRVDSLSKKKETMPCPWCGSEVPEGSIVCPYCDSALEEEGIITEGESWDDEDEIDLED